MEIDNRFVTIAWLFLIISLLTACSKDCFVADTYEEMRDPKINNNQLYLYIKTTGFNEKEHFFQLYSTIPVFDECGTPSVEPVSEKHIDTTAGNVDKITIRDKQIIVIYSKTKKTKKTSLNQTTVELE